MSSVNNTSIEYKIQAEINETLIPDLHSTGNLLN